MMSDLIRGFNRPDGYQVDPDVMADFTMTLGDMNYRLNAGYDEIIQEIDSIVDNRKKYDQFEQSLLEGNYPYYEEGEINFMPTYKKDKSTLKKFLIAQVSSVGAWGIAYPVDTVRRHMMMQSGNVEPLGYQETFKQIYKEKGI